MDIANSVIRLAAFELGAFCMALDLVAPAHKCIRWAADKGHHKAQHYLAMQHMFGSRLPLDRDKAVAYLKASRTYYPPSQDAWDKFANVLVSQDELQQHHEAVQRLKGEFEKETGRRLISRPKPWRLSYLLGAMALLWVSLSLVVHGGAGPLGLFTGLGAGALIYLYMKR